MGQVFGDLTQQQQDEAMAMGHAEEGAASVLEAEIVTEEPKKYRHKTIIEARPYVKGEDLEDVENTGFLIDDPDEKGYIAWPVDEPEERAFIEADDFNEYFEEI